MVAPGARLSGPVAELYRYGSKAGLLYEWRFSGWKREWRIEAERYKLDALLFSKGGRDVRVVLRLGGMEIIAAGNIWTDYQADGHSHRALIVKGTNLSWDGKPASLAQLASVTA